MEALLVFGIAFAFIGLTIFIAAWSQEDDKNLVGIFGVIVIIALIMVIVGGVNLQHEKSLNRGRLEGAQNPQYLKIKEVIYDNSIPKDTIYVYEIPKILED
jgi:uncharacterized membrane protein YidH (DUF202 family)